MIEKDILTKNMHLFVEKLVSLLSGQGSFSENMEKLNNYSGQLLDFDREYFISLSIDELYLEFGKEKALYKIRILAEIYYVDSILRKDKNRVLYAKKALEWFSHYSLENEIYDVEIQNKMKILSQIIKENE